MLILNFKKVVVHILKHKHKKVFVFYLSGKRYAFLGKITGYPDGRKCMERDTIIFYTIRTQFCFNL